jgi:hypothetical protein
VQILLLNPDSLAATQRTHDHDDPDVCREIMRNLRALCNFRNTIRPASLNRNPRWLEHQDSSGRRRPCPADLAGHHRRAAP